MEVWRLLRSRRKDVPRIASVQYEFCSREGRTNFASEHQDERSEDRREMGGTNNGVA